MVFCNRFVFECFVPNIRLLWTRTYQIVGFTVLTYFTSILGPVKLFSRENTAID